AAHCEGPASGTPARRPSACAVLGSVDRAVHVSYPARNGLSPWLGELALGQESSVTVPPACSIFAAAVAENACAVTRRATSISPVPSTLISSPLRAAPLATRFSGVTSPPSGNSSASRPVFTTW